MGHKTLALVTGASSGIGEAIARGLARRGTDLVLVARSEARLDALADELHSTDGIDVEVIAADLTDANQLAIVDKRLLDEQRPVELLVNNAGFGSNGLFAELPIDAEVNQIELNVVALVRLTHTVLPGMIERGRGGILNVSSVASFQPAPRSATYAATKAYVTSFSEALHEELRGTGVKLTCLCPGFTRTRFHDRADMDRDSIPGPLWLDADVVAEAGIKGLERGDPMVVPGAAYKVASVMTRVIPRRVLRRTAGVVTKRY